MEWATEEMKQVNLGDKRLDIRAVNLLNKLGNKPLETIPMACQGWAETKAAYRFFDNGKVTEEKILAPHIEATLGRMELYPTVLLIQDTTHLNYSTQFKKQDIGPLIHKNYRGILLHPTIAVTPEGVCLGVIDSYHWYRSPTNEKTRRQKNAANLQTPIEQKESYRWLLGYQKADAIAAKIPSQQLVSIADREADIYDIYHEAAQAHCHAKWLIRSIKNRPLVNALGQREPNKLWDVIRQNPVSDYCEFELPARGAKPARKVKLSIRAKTVCLHPPTGRRGKLRCKPVMANGVIATEMTPPHGEKPIEWLLLTNLPIASSKERLAIMQYYVCRWQIEVFFRILKSGCRVEQLQLNCAKRYGPCLTLYLIIAWRILYLTLLSRLQPNASSEFFFHSVEWQTAYLISKKRKPPKRAPPLTTTLLIIANLGGFLNRKNDKAPGPASIWRGLQRLTDLTIATQICHEIYG